MRLDTSKPVIAELLPNSDTCPKVIGLRPVNCESSRTASLATANGSEPVVWDTVTYCATVNFTAPGTSKIYGPSNPVAEKVTFSVVPEPATDAESVLIPAVPPRVQVPAEAPPEALVTPRLLAMLAVPLPIVNETRTPANTVPPSVTITLGAVGTAVALEADCPSPAAMLRAGLAA